MTTSTLTLADFLLARFDEAEQLLTPAVDYAEFMGGRMIDGREFVRADFEAKRRIVEIHQHRFWHTRVTYPLMHLCPSEDRDQQPTGYFQDDDGPCDTLRLLALPYASHPEFRAEWAV